MDTACNGRQNARDFVSPTGGNVKLVSKVIAQSFRDSITVHDWSGFFDCVVRVWRVESDTDAPELSTHTIILGGASEAELAVDSGDEEREGRKKTAASVDEVVKAEKTYLCIYPHTRTKKIFGRTTTRTIRMQTRIWTSSATTVR